MIQRPLFEELAGLEIFKSVDSHHRGWDRGEENKIGSNRVKNPGSWLRWNSPLLFRTQPWRLSNLNSIKKIK